MSTNYYRRNLPHWQPVGAKYFITFRLAGSLPQTAIERLKFLKNQLGDESPTNDHSEEQIQRKIFLKYELYLEEGYTGPTWLEKPKVANIVKEAIHYRDKNKYDLYAYCIMYNHVHLIFKHLQPSTSEETSHNIKYPTTDILRNLKRHTAYQSNRLLNRTGLFGREKVMIT